MVEYGRVTALVIEELASIVGEQGVVHGDHDRLATYSRDETGPPHVSFPDAVVKPATPSQVSEILVVANRERIPVTPRGAGSGLAGGAVPAHGGIVLSSEKMNRVLEIDTVNRIAVVQPGVITNDLCRAVADVGLFYAGYPMSVELSCIGGNVACNAGGAKVIKYGATAAHVLGLEVVLPSGEILEMGGKRRKDASGYPLMRLFIGSEGTLGFFTRIHLNLLPQPGAVADLLVAFESIEAAIRALPSLIAAGRDLPVAAEFMDRASAAYCSEYTGYDIPLLDRAGAFLILQLDARTKSELEDVYESAGTTCLKCGALDVFVADNRTTSERIWSLRRNWLEALRAVDPSVITGDFVVPVSEIPRMMAMISALGGEYGAEIPCAGHAADGNIHPAPLRPDRISPEAWRPTSEEILERIAEEAAALGGAASGEHGIGIAKRSVFSRTKGSEIRLMRRIKELLDPNWIMNPGKLFDDLRAGGQQG